MKLRPLLMTLALLPLLAACGQTNAPGATTPATETAPATAPAAETPAPGTDAAAPAAPPA
ncbi:thiol:disulfide interchange protein DsbA/DsbL, partial [Pseudoxanthomonas sp. PXM04]|nr:thiol:disulfide interchange protein DsbA/DsbL [Pseudoxanthomonas sp. PXM04]